MNGSEVVLREKSIKLDIRNDDMQAYVMLSPADYAYSDEDILGHLRQNGVTYGIKNDVISRMIDRKEYDKFVLVAEGLDKIDGKDGSYEYYFDYKTDNKPKVLIDGSLDYRTLQIIQVKEGDELARYTPAEAGERGFDVRGRVLLPYRGKEIKPIKGKGFNVTEDRRLYTAALSGKLEYKDEKLIISNVMEIQGDVDYLSGDVSFDGDIMVYGSVNMGMKIKAAGAVMIQGYMESAEIYAGKDVVLQNGAQGAGKGIIETKGNVSGKFFEQMHIRAGGDVNANSILNCEVECGGEVVVSGKLGIIVGGKIKSTKHITATIIGNMAQIKTELEVGVPESAYFQISGIDNEIQTKSVMITKLENATAALNRTDKGANPGVTQQKKLEIMRNKINLSKEIAELTNKRSEIMALLEYSQFAKVVATKRLHPGVRITVNGETMTVNTEVENVTVKRRGRDVLMFSNV